MSTIYHNHHIIPRHAGGKDEPGNIVRLTVTEHAEAHRILFQTYGRWQDEIAWRMLSGQISPSEASSKAKKEGCIKGGKISGNKRKGQRCSTEAKQNMSKGRIGMRLSGNHIKNVVNRVSRTWEFIDPEGTIMVVKNKADFCRKNFLTPNTMTLVAQGKQSHHKGWSCKKL